MRVVTIPDSVHGTGPVLMLNMLKFTDRRLYVEEYLGDQWLRILQSLLYCFGFLPMCLSNIFVKCPRFSKPM